jgi:diaminopimelate epimerase
MPRIEFTKMQGSGNDFIMIDNRDGVVADSDKVELVRHVCPRATAIGADGVIFLENDREYDFRWDFYNADGSSAEMCGNGARCVAVFANQVGAAGSNMTFRTIAGPIAASLVEGGAKVKLTDANLPEEIPLPLKAGERKVFFIDTGVPHVVVPVADIEAIDIKPDGSEIRYHQRFQPAGTNVNFICRQGDEILIRTYERGVEDETLACGTGSVAAAIVSQAEFGTGSPVTIITRSGIRLSISFERTSGDVCNIFLEGPVVEPYSGSFGWK